MPAAVRRAEPAQVVRQTTGGASWEIATRAPAVALRPFIRDVCGYAEQGVPGLVRRIELPGPQVVVIFELGPPIAVLDNRAGHRPHRYPDGGFVAGLDDRHTFIEYEGVQRGLQLNLTPVGARLFFDLPMSEIAGRVVHVNDLLPREHRCATEQLAALPDWDARFDLIERLVASRLARARAPHPAIVWAYDQIQRTGGTIEMRRLARELGYSRTHLIALFRDQIGFPPKLVARITRFERLIRRLKTGTPTAWADLAAECGYYDQAHLVRDMHEFAGMTPTRARSLALEMPGGVIFEQLRAAQAEAVSELATAAVAAAGSPR
jgi:AraC-like DNA-binding protein